MRIYTTILLTLLFFSATVFSQSIPTSFFDKTDLLLSKVVAGGLVDYNSLQQNNAAELNQLTRIIAAMPAVDLQDASVRKAFYINAYNILTLKAVVDNLPVNSPQDVDGFFDRRKHVIAGEQLTLNDLENKKIRDEFGDARVHFVLVCAAKGCPILIPEAYRPSTLDKQLDMQTRVALNDPLHVEVNVAAKEVKISELFKWYKEDFVPGNQNPLIYINRFRNTAIPTSYSVGYKTYNWALNARAKATGSSDSEFSLQSYTPSTLLRPGQIEVKIFNNLYTQTSGFNENRDEIQSNERASFFSGITTAFYGITPRINVGIDVYFRSVRNDTSSSSPFALFQFDSDQRSRTALTQIGPKVKVNPFRNLPGLTFQTTVLFPLGSNFDGQDASKSQPFIDFDGIQWFNQLFYDRLLSDNTLIYFEGGLFARFGAGNEDFFTPIKAIFNYYPTDKTTLYLPTEFTSFWDDGSINAYYTQLGIGAKYQLTKNLEIESLFTDFSFGKSQGAGQTFNLGFRYIR